MLPLKLVRSLVLGETINNSILFNQDRHHHHHHHLDDGDGDVHSDGDGDGDVHHVHHTHHQSTSRRARRRRRKGNNNNSNSNNNTMTPLLYFLPTKEIIKDTYRLATIARDMGMDLYPNPSLSHMIFSWPSSSSTSSSPPSSSSLPSLWSSSSSTWSLSGDSVPLPFPSLTSASAAHLHCFINLSRGLFKLVFYKFNNNIENPNTNNWNCSSLSLFSRVTGDRIDSMDGFSRVLAGMGWTLFKTKSNPSLVSGDFSFCCPNSVYLFRKIDSNRVQARQSDNGGSKTGEFRLRELRLPTLDFRNAPLRILQYILIMTDDVFYLA